MRGFKKLTLEETKEWHVTLWTEVVKRLQQGVKWNRLLKRKIIHELNMVKLEYDCSLCDYFLAKTIAETINCDSCPLKVQHPPMHDLTGCGDPWESLVRGQFKGKHNQKNDIANAILIRDLDLSKMKPKNH